MQTNNISKQTRISFSDRVSQVMDVPRDIVAMALDYPDGYVIPFHHHPRAQLLYAVAGVMTVTTEKGTWVVPPQRGVWIPPMIEHQIVTSGQLSMRTLYIRKDAVPGLPVECYVANITPLLRELILYMVNLPIPYPLGGPEERIVAVVFDQIRSLSMVPLNLPRPKDPRLQTIHKALTEDPANSSTLGQWGRQVGASERTLARIFRNETGMSFRQWRQQFKLLEALKYLANDMPVTTVAMNLGYDSVSAFIHMFKKAVGKTPANYFKGILA
jgi:AraC-like DNA-binding protein/quercetin dioxygenase-like cupin family protein